MSKFNSGDRVLVNGSLVATVKVYDEGSGQLVLVQELGGGAINEIYGPIPSYNLQHLVAEAVGSDTRPGEDAPAESETPAETTEEGPQDQITTSGFLS